MVGIIGYGAWIPYYRLKRENIGEAWGAIAGAGERAVANFDEDSVSMAVNAALDCLPRGTGRSPNDVATAVDSLFFATTSPPYKEKGSTATIASALGLQKNVHTMEVGSSLRAGVTALITASRGAADGKNALVTVADCRLGAPEGANEQLLGDGAAAFLVGSENVLAEVEHCYSYNQDLQGYWQGPDEKFLQSAEERFAGAKYVEIVVQALKGFAAETGASVQSFQQIVLDAPHPKLQKTITKLLDIKPEQMTTSIAAQVGHSGCANAPLMLAKALSQAKSGDRILVLAFGEGCDIITFKITEKINNFNSLHTVHQQLEHKNNHLKYTSYLKWREILDTEPPRRPAIPVPSQPALFRGYRQNLDFEGCKCTHCGTPQFPKQRVCVHCQAKDQFEPYGFRGRKARIVTYTVDYLAVSPAPPTVFAVVDFDGGGRMMVELTDYSPDEVDIGTEVEFTFRKLYTAAGVSNYFWKAVPVTAAAQGGGSNE